jgi:NTE family protein
MQSVRNAPCNIQFAYAGAFEVLYSTGILASLERVGGTSAGAIQAALLAVGYSGKEIIQLTAGVQPQAFNDGSFPGNSLNTHLR